MSNTLVSQPPRGWLRFALRLPILAYRLGMGWLLGERFVLLNHVGRKSGKSYRTVVETVDHDQGTDTYYVVSGWGYQAQWYQNLMAQRAITIQVGGRTLSVCAATLDPASGADILLNYRAAHHFAARELSRLMGIDIHHSTPAELATTVAEKLPVVALRPRRTTPCVHSK